MIGVSRTKVYDFSFPANYLTNNIVVNGGVASLVPTVPGPGKNKTSDFSVPGDYTYNAGILQVAAFQANFIDLRPANATFFNSGAAFNANWANGSLVGTPNGAAAIVAGKIQLQGVNTFMSWVPLNNADFTQTGTIRLTYTPNYSGTPLSDQAIFVASKAVGDASNLLDIEHFTDGRLYFQVSDSGGTPIVAGNFAWAPVAGTSYELELDFDITAGASRFFIDGIQQGVTILTTGIRTNSVGQFLSGDNYTGAFKTPNYSISNLILFSTVQHTANYIPGAAIPPTIYSLVDSTLDFTVQAIINDPLLGLITSITATITAAGGDAIQFAVSLDQGVTFQYWNGVAWAISNSTFVQTNTLAVLNANLPTLNVTGGNFELRALFHSNNGSTTPILQTVVVNYYDLLFGIGTILAKLGFPAQNIINFISQFSITGLDKVQFAFKVNSFLMYYNGTAWVLSDGSFTKTNTIAQVLQNLSTLLDSNSTVFPYVILSSGNGSSSPTITNIVITYDFGVAEAPAPNTCIVYGFVRDIQGNPVEGVTVKFVLTTKNPKAYMESASHVLLPGAISVVTDENGYFEQPVVSSDQFQGTNTQLTVQFIKDSAEVLVGPTRSPLAIQVPVQESVDITTLLQA